MSILPSAASPTAAKRLTTGTWVGPSRLWVGVACIMALSGCSTAVDRLRYDDSGVTPDTGVTLLRDAPRPGLYQSIGERSWSFYRPGFHEPGIGDVWPDLSQKVRASGGDACLVKYQYVSTWTARSIDVTCDVLKSIPRTASNRVNEGNVVSAPAERPVGRFQYSVDRLLSDLSCKPELSARLVSSSAGIENYSGTCRNGDTAIVRCEFGSCRVLQ